MKPRHWHWIWASVVLGALCGAMSSAFAASDEAPDEMMRRLAAEVMASAKAPGADADESRRVTALVDTQIMPNVDFVRMTAAVVGRSWREASAAQRERLQDEFKRLLVRTYAGALMQLKDRTVTVKPLRAGADATDVIVHTLVKGGGEPVALDYRLEKSAAGWKIIDLNVMGIWLVETYRGQFAAEIGARGVEGLITALSERNRLVAKAR